MAKKFVSLKQYDPIYLNDGNEPTLNVGIANNIGLNIPMWDYVSVTYPDAVTEIFNYKYGGVSGDTVASITVIYSDSTKSNLLSLSKS